MDKKEGDRERKRFERERRVINIKDFFNIFNIKWDEAVLKITERERERWVSLETK